MTDQTRTYRSAAAGNIGPGFKPGFYPDPLWVDQNIDVLAVTIPGANSAPTAYAIPGTGLSLANFPNGPDITEIEASAEFYHAWIAGTAIKPHLHVRKIDTGNGNIFLGFEYQVLRDSTLVSGEKTATVAVDDTAQLNEILFVGFDDVDLSTITEVGAQITYRFYRDPTNVADTFAGDIAITTAGWHLQVDAGGSRGVVTK